MNLAVFDKIRGLVYTEKSSKGLENNVYSFKVDPSATKDEIKSFVESFFKVEVEKVNVINVSGKVKKFRGITGKRKDFKKALVKVKEGQSINFSKD